MKKNKLLWIVIPAAAVLIAAIVITAAVLVSGQMKEDKYYEQMNAARNYMAEMNYDKVVEAYKAAIDIKPESSMAYIELAEVYIEMEEYTNASYIAELGFLKSGDEELTTLAVKIDELRKAETVMKIMPEKVPEDAVESNGGDDSSVVSIRYATIENAANFCFQEYISEYGEATMTKVSDEDGYQAKFKSFSGYAYFKNTPENRNAVEEATRRPAKNAKPYKVALTSPSLLFVGYNGYVSSGKLNQFFGINETPSLDSSVGKYFIEFEYMECRIRLETDAAGNMGENPVIELYPLKLIKEDWVDEEETEESEEVKTFTLGNHTYTYDVTSIVISSEDIGDLSPLADCKDLRELVLVDCTVGSLDPLSGCTSLTTLDLRWSVGFSDLSPLSGLGSLLYLDLHGCADVSDISPIMGMSLKLLHTCETGVSYEQTQAYKDAHPDCEVWYDNHTL